MSSVAGGSAVDDKPHFIPNVAAGRRRRIAPSRVSEPPCCPALCPPARPCGAPAPRPVGRASFAAVATRSLAPSALQPAEGRLGNTGLPGPRHGTEAGQHGPGASSAMPRACTVTTIGTAAGQAGGRRDNPRAADDELLSLCEHCRTTNLLSGRAGGSPYRSGRTVRSAAQLLLEIGVPLGLVGLVARLEVDRGIVLVEADLT